MEAQSPKFDGESAVPPSRQGRCPVCGSVDVALRCGGGQQAIELTRTCAFVQRPFQILECRACGIVFKDSILSAEKFSLLYADMDFTRWEIKTLYPTERAVIEIIRRMPHRSRILDFGCSSGRLMAQLSGDYECFGFEINEEAARTATAKGICIIPSIDGSEYIGSMDAVVLVDVFEHLENPFPFLKKLVRLLKPGGILIVVTGDADCEAGRPDLANFWYFRTIHHVGMLTRRHAEFLGRELKMRLERWESVSHYDAGIVEKFAQRMRQYVFKRNKERPNSLLSAVFRALPVLKRSASWTIPPPFTVSRDHAVVVWSVEE